MNKTNTGLVTFVKACVGRSYVYGTYGQILTNAILNAKAITYPDRLTPSRVEKARREFIGKRTYDCSGLIKSYLWSESPDSNPVRDAKQDVNANTMFEMAKEKGEIGTIPEIVGLNVRYPGHVGTYIGNGLVVEARGFNYGVVITKLKERKWTHWFKNPFITYADVPTPAPTPTGGKCMVELSVLKKGSKGDEVTSLQWLLFSLGFKDQNGKSLDRDGSFGGKTEYAVKSAQSKYGLTVDGVVGTKTWTKLIERG